MMTRWSDIPDHCNKCDSDDIEGYIGDPVSVVLCNSCGNTIGIIDEE